MGKKLYRFNYDGGRMGSLSGLFVADEETEIRPAIGKRAHFGEVLGKHSEVYFDLKQKHMAALTDDSAFVSKFEEYGCESGFNPLGYITCPECGDTLAAPYVKCDCGWTEEEA